MVLVTYKCDYFRIGLECISLFIVVGKIEMMLTGVIHTDPPEGNAVLSTWNREYRDTYEHIIAENTLGNNTCVSLQFFIDTVR